MRLSNFASSSCWRGRLLFVPSPFCIKLAESYYKILFRKFYGAGFVTILPATGECREFTTIASQFVFTRVRNEIVILVILDRYSSILRVYIFLGFIKTLPSFRKRFR